MKHFFLLAAGLLVGSQATAQKQPAVSAATVERVARTLTADDMAGRPSAGPGNLKAGQFLAAEFKRIGLKPLPGKDNFLQEFEAYEAQTSARTATLNGTTLPPDNIVLSSGLPQVDWTNTDATIRTVMVGAQDNLFQVVRPLLDLHENTVVIVDPAHQAQFKRLLGLNKGSVKAQQPAAHAVAMLLATAPLEGAAPTYAVTATTTIKPVAMRNVVGILPGRDKKLAPEMVVFSAHYDHLGITQAVAGDSIANGADDDASGTTAVVALAEYYKKQKKNARTLVFVAFTAEEIGGFGSQYFSRQLDPDKVVAMFNIEMIGKVAKFGPNTAFITGYERSDFGPLLQQNLQGSPFRFEPDPYPEQNLFYRSDNATLAKLGVPAHTISTDQIPTDKLYHSVDDEIESLDLQNMTAVINAIARSATSIISGQQTPTRVAKE
ncbi:M20/M25/M40 family metallo-hydrolase [Hymenobacter defluvii]|uniref:M20/M25/M40 family metallo-hydrolase n=1 Tax=Hymenobacter defluvii TaxID=2054411 RepID=A0ABS3T8N1_9BACT|nr:M20/M25/M40 family metallo-hydrolase [Hymenobacter defluvii]MBO3269145.1 M20/M25/M40 family metallo-hydrolase [Hymenobacter defluvii]